MRKSIKAGSQAPIFVVGAARSGTTLLQRMLRSHPNIASPTGESQFIIFLYRHVLQYGNLNQQDNVKIVLGEMRRLSRQFIDEDMKGLQFDIEQLSAAMVEAGANSIASIVDYLLTADAQGQNKKRWLDKTPYYSLHIPVLLQLFPSAQFIHLIRDGRDCALSMLDRRFDLGTHNIYKAAYKWKLNVDEAQVAGAHLRENQYIEIRYEKLLQNTESEVRRLCAFLNEDFDSQVIEFEKSTDTKTKTPMLKQSIDSSNVDKWRNKLSARQVAIYEAVAGETLLRNGYQLAGRSRQIHYWESLFYRLHNRLAQYSRFS